VLSISAFVIAAAIAWAGWHIARELAASRQPRPALDQLLAAFAPGVAAVTDDPRALLAWQPLAATARRLFPEEFAALDEASGSTFPFSTEQIQAAHARWTADWLAWERGHDTDYKLKITTLEHDLGEAFTSPYGRTRVDALEREKLDRYQRRYEEYTRVAKALQGLLPKT
jgi:hypothetical protein